MAIDVRDTDLTIHCDDGPRTVARTTTQPVTQIKAHWPRKVQATIHSRATEGSCAEDLRE